MRFLIILTMMLSLNSFAAEKKSAKPEPKREPTAEELAALSIRKDTQIEVSYYDKDSDTFEVVIVKEPGVGPNVATPEALHKAAGINADIETFQNKKADYVGAEFQLKEDLSLLDDEQIEKRREHNKK
ncbi:hypothetical protein [Bdellovibrio sp. BCCA]|uniref:hypothetical protein n=1 Tax=Bdellovibrio sp. BCCA TaxID=3136281 RepID=UPI0030F244B8